MSSAIDDLVVDLAKEDRSSSVTPPSVLFKLGMVFLMLAVGLLLFREASGISWIFLFCAAGFASSGALFGFPSKERAAKILLGSALGLSLFAVLLGTRSGNVSIEGVVPRALVMLAIASGGHVVLLSFLARLAPMPVDLAVGLGGAMGLSLAFAFEGGSIGAAGGLTLLALLTWPVSRGIYRSLQGRFLSSRSILWRTGRNPAPPQSELFLSEPTYDVLGREIRPEELTGKNVWIVLYRYVGCPICAAHLADLKAWLKKHSPPNLSVLLVYESPAERLQVLASQLGDLPIRVLADPENQLYSRLGSRLSLAGMFKPGAFLAMARAVGRGFLQGKIDGDLRRHPAHLLTNAEGVHCGRYLGSHIGDHIPWRDVSRFALR